VKEKVFKIKSGEEYMTLNVLLKLAGLIETGGMAKIFLAENAVFVNGEAENRRGRKLYHGDRILIGNSAFLVE